jgi:hypothetical protein
VNPRAPVDYGDREMGSNWSPLVAERSVWYVFLMGGRVPNYHYLTPTFQLFSLGSSVNRGNPPPPGTRNNRQHASNSKYSHLADKKWSPGHFPKTKTPVIVKV